MKEPYKPSAVELQNGWLQVDICMRLGFSFYLWQRRFQPENDQSDDCRFMRAAALQCSLLNIRSLDEFFSPSNSNNDIRADHYPRFPNPGPFLTTEEKKQLHQMIGHITYRRFREFDTSWNVFLLLERAYQRFGPFLDYVHDVEFPDQINVQASIQSMKRRYEEWLSDMRSVETARSA